MPFCFCFDFGGDKNLPNLDGGDIDGAQNFVIGNLDDFLPIRRKLTAVKLGDKEIHEMQIVCSTDDYPVMIGDWKAVAVSKLGDDQDTDQDLDTDVCPSADDAPGSDDDLNADAEDDARGGSGDPADVEDAPGGGPVEGGGVPSDPSWGR